MDKTEKSTPAERQAAFKQLFDSIPGKKVDKIRLLAKEVLFCEENTIRIYLCGSRTIPHSKLMVMQKHLAE